MNSMSESHFLFQKMAVSTHQMLQNATDPYVDFIKRKEFIDHWMLIPYDQDAVGQLSSEKLTEIHQWLIEQKSAIENWELPASQ
jgi:hypothetical protein